MSILDEILEHKRHEVAAARAKRSDDDVAKAARSNTDPARGFRRRLLEAPAPVVIAELKRRSPSRGVLRADFDPIGIARDYAGAGAAALSILTDERFFGGSLGDLRDARAAVGLPVLRKDFLIDRYQVDEARAAGADAVLLIVAALPPDALASLHEYALEAGLDVLVEVHDERELETALSIGADLIGVNNRNLRTFETHLDVTERLAGCLTGSSIEDVLLVAESGIQDPADIDRLASAGARAFLVGEALMGEPDVGLALKRLRRSA